MITGLEISLYDGEDSLLLMSECSNADELFMRMIDTEGDHGFDYHGSFTHLSSCCE